MEQANRNGRRILVVEDEPGIAQICARTLSAEGFEVEVAVNGEAALDLLHQEEFALCFIDIRTPKMSGIELYRQLQERHPEMVHKLIFTSGDVLSSDTMAFLESTNRPYLAKPFIPEDLRAIVRTVLGLT
jgi:DNA-binding response OmpR family regulator